MAAPVRCFRTCSVGERLRLFVRTSGDAYVTVLNVGATRSHDGAVPQSDKRPALAAGRARHEWLLDSARRDSRASARRSNPITLRVSRLNWHPHADGPASPPPLVLLRIAPLLQLRHRRPLPRHLHAP